MKERRFIWGIFLFCIIAVCLYPRLARAEENSVSVLMSYAGVDGDMKRFRQDLWMDRTFNAGIEDLTFKRDLGDGKHLTMEGRALSDNDYKFLLNLDKEEFGYMNLSYDTWRKYYDDSGEYYVFPTAGLPSWYELGKDLHTDRSTLSLDFGLTLPDKPKYTLGYERKTKKGEMAIGSMGTVTDTAPAPDDSKYLYPWSKEIDWVVDTVKAGTEFKLKNVNIALEQRYEEYDDHWYMDNIYTLTDDTFPAAMTVVEDQDPAYKAYVTTLLADSQINENLFVKGGYLFNSTDSDLKWERNYYTSTGALRSSYYDGTQDSDLDNHIISLGTRFKPLNNLLLTTRLRYENSDTASSSSYIRDGRPYGPGGYAWNGVDDFLAQYSSKIDESTFGENVGLEYNGIPRTRLYVDAEWEQSELKYLESQGGLGIANGYQYDPDTYDRDTDADLDSDTYTIGINTRPIRPLFISARYRRINKDNEYTDNIDNPDGGSYPAYIGDNSRKTDEYTIRTKIRPCKFASFTIKYQQRETSYEVDKENPDGIADFDSQITSLGLTLTPTSKLFINTLYSFQDAEIRTLADEDEEAVRTEPYNGDSNSFITTASYALNEKTSLSSQYQRWAADEEDGVFQGLSLGVERRIKEDLLLKLGYAFYEFNEDTNAGIDDYKANVIYTSLSGKF